MKLTANNIDTTGCYEHWGPNYVRLLKKTYSGLLNHWRKVDDNNLLYQFAWRQKIFKKAVYGEHDNIYPDFNYGSNAMICNLSLQQCTGSHYKNYYGKNLYMSYLVMMNFSSVDDDIMYGFCIYFKEKSDAEQFMKEVMKQFQTLFKTAYKNRQSIYEATYETMCNLFLNNTVAIEGYIN